MHRAVYILALGIFAMVTSEFVVAGLMVAMADGLGVTVPEIGYLITGFAAAMALGGPVLNLGLLRVPPRRALIVLFAVFLTGNVLAATAPSYSVMMAARIATGASSGAFFGTAVSLCVRLADPRTRGRAVAVVMNGLMLGTLVGLPLATFVGERYGWRTAFWAIAVLVVIAATTAMVGLPRVDADRSGGIGRELSAFRSPRLWLTMTTSMFVIAATFAAFSYVNPILTAVSGFSADTVPLLLIGYGAATVAGNIVVGRLADRYAVPTVFWGLLLNLGFLAGFASLTHHRAAAVACLLGIGLVGVTMNPALVTRVQRVGNPGPMVNTVHASLITVGVMIGSSLGGIAITLYGLRATLWLGAIMAALGVLTLIPDLRGPVPAAGVEGPDAGTRDLAVPAGRPPG